MGSLVASQKRSLPEILQPSLSAGDSAFAQITMQHFSRKVSYFLFKELRVAKGCDFLCNRHYCKSSKYFKSLYLQGRESESQLLIWVLTHGQAIVGLLRSACVQPSWGHTRLSSQNPEQSLITFSPLQGVFPVLFAVAQTPQLI